MRSGVLGTLAIIGIILFSTGCKKEKVVYDPQEELSLLDPQVADTVWAMRFDHEKLHSIGFPINLQFVLGATVTLLELKEQGAILSWKLIGGDELKKFVIENSNNEQLRAFLVSSYVALRTEFNSNPKDASEIQELCSAENEDFHKLIEDGITFSSAIHPQCLRPGRTIQVAFIETPFAKLGESCDISTFTSTARVGLLSQSVRRRAMMQQGAMNSCASIPVLRSDVYRTTCSHLVHAVRDAKDLMNLQTGLRILFAKSGDDNVMEDGLDAGGLSREWFGLVMEELFDENFELFKKKDNEDGGEFMIQKLSRFDLQAMLPHYKIFGTLLGLGLLHNLQIPFPLTRNLYRAIMDLPVDLDDLESEEPHRKKSLTDLGNADLKTEKGKGFAKEFSFNIYVEMPGGKRGSYNINDRTVKEDEAVNPLNLLSDDDDEVEKPPEVTAKNRKEFIRLRTRALTRDYVEDQLNAIKRGLYGIVPREDIQMYIKNAKEFEEAITGSAEIDPDDWEAHTRFTPSVDSEGNERMDSFNKDSKQVKWFFEIIKTWNAQQLQKLLKFTTGSTTTPTGGFSKLSPQFTITPDSEEDDPDGRLPSSHTCGSQLVLPLYKSKDALSRQLLLAIEHVDDGFALK